MVSTTHSRNQIQALDVNVSDEGNPANIGTTVVVLYTCPANRRALVKSFKARFTGLGANTALFQRAKGQRLREDNTGTETTMVEVAGNGIRLTAGQTIDLAGDNAANNGSAFFDFTVQELPA